MTAEVALSPPYAPLTLIYMHVQTTFLLLKK